MTRKRLAFFLFLLFFTGNPAFTGDIGKIAVGAEGETAAAAVSEVAARSLYFLIFDGTGALLEAVGNPYCDAKGGASSSVVSFLSEKGVTFFVAGDFGEKIIPAMKDGKIQYLEFHGTAGDALKKTLEMRQ